jgi:hypothetical protein
MMADFPTPRAIVREMSASDVMRGPPMLAVVSRAACRAGVPTSVEVRPPTGIIAIKAAKLRARIVIDPILAC